MRLQIDIPDDGFDSLWNKAAATYSREFPRRPWSSDEKRKCVREYLEKIVTAEIDEFRGRGLAASGEDSLWVITDGNGFWMRDDFYTEDLDLARQGTDVEMATRIRSRIWPKAVKMETVASLRKKRRDKS